MQTRSCTVEKKTAETGSYIDPESVAVCFRSTGCRVSEQRPGNLYIEKLDQRSHKKGCDDRADADNRGYRGNASAARQIDDDSSYDTTIIVTPDPAFGGTLYSGGSSEGYIVATVKKDDATPTMQFGSDYQGKGGIWFALTK